MLQIIGRCVDSISSKTAIDPLKVDWSFSYKRPSSSVTDHSGGIEQQSPASWNGPHSRGIIAVPKDWWVEDICELDVDLYSRVMVAVKAKGMSPELVGEAIKVYALRWLPGVSKEQTLHDNGQMVNEDSSYEYTERATKNRVLLETLVSLLPAEKGASSCSFLLKLLKAATVLNASSTTRVELARSIGLQLEEASLRDLLIPSPSYANESLYDVDLVLHIMEHYLIQNQSPPISPNRAQPPQSERSAHSAENLDCSESRQMTSATHSSKLKVAKLIDKYLAEIARDSNLPLTKFMQIAELVPDFARPIHDGLYRAIDMYLKVCTLLASKQVIL